MRKCFLLLMVMCAFLLGGCAEKVAIDSIDILPEPDFVVLKEGNFEINRSSHVRFKNLGQNSETARYITRSLRKNHLRMSLSKGAERKGDITFMLNESPNTEIGDEGYLLEVREQGILISANTETGLFYGYQTLLQILPTDISKVRYYKIQIPQCTILDSPKYPWRASQLDVVSHFYSVTDIHRHLDLMALYKMNTLHLYLFGDEGCRIEIEKYPDLNYVGSWRIENEEGYWKDSNWRGLSQESNYGGYYTKEEIREIIDYARALHIQIVPEISLLGSNNAILRSYPSMGCQSNAEKIEKTPALCFGNDTVVQFMRDLCDEIIRLFPCPYLQLNTHIETQEVRNHCNKCLARCEEQQEPLAEWVVGEMEHYCALQGRTLIVGDEVAHFPLLDSTIIIAHSDSLCWSSLLLSHHPLLYAPSRELGLMHTSGNVRYHTPGDTLPLSLARIFDLEIPADIESHILGGTCWFNSHYADSYAKAETLLLPRLSVVSELFWCKKKQTDWSYFRRKLVRHKEMLTALGYHPDQGSFYPILRLQATASGFYKIELDYEVEGSKVYYSTSPLATQRKELYSQPFLVAPGSTIRAIIYLNGDTPEEEYTYLLP